MAIEMILMADVADLGAEGQVVKVADGYARNYLIPRKLAAPVTEATRRRLAKQRREREEQQKLELTAAKDLAARMSKVSCTIAAKAGTEEKLYGSVTNADIADSLKSQGFAIDKQKIGLDEPIKELGVYDISIKLHPEVEATVKVWVVEE